MNHTYKSIVSLLPLHIMLWLSILFALAACDNNHNAGQQDEVLQTDSIAKVNQELVFGFPKEDYRMCSHTVKNNENIAEILGREGVSYSSILQLVEHAKGIFDVKKLRSHKPYHILYNKSDTSLQQAAYMVYEKDYTNYVVFHLKDSLQVWNKKKNIEYYYDTVSGTIQNSLWVSLQEQGANVEIANELSEIYGWTIDFFGIQKGDSYQVLCENILADGDTLGLHRIIASRFTHIGEPYSAYYFNLDSVTGEYFDDQGNSMRKTFLKAPLRYKRISSKFSHNRYHPVLKIYRPHHGVDYAAASGTPVYTIGDGVVIKKGYQRRGGGNYVKIKHNGTYTSVYMHLRGFAKGLHTGQKLKQGDLIGYVGATGLATGPHLDFRIFKNGTPINPLKVKSTPAKPVPDSLMVHFEQMRDSLNVYI